MQRIKRFYYKHIYAVIGTLVFHIALVMTMLLYNVSEKRSYTEPEILIDMSMLEELQKEPLKQEEQTENRTTNQTAKTNQASRMGDERLETTPSRVKDPFFDEEFQKEVDEAKELASDVSNQLNKKTKALEEYIMPEQTTDGMNPDSISNVVYSGESNIYYDLKNRYHRRMPIPVYLAKGGGKVVVNIWVNTSGKVVKAEIKSTENMQDPLLTAYALQAAQRTLFNKDNSAPNPQLGTISYIFIAQ